MYSLSASRPNNSRCIGKDKCIQLSHERGEEQPGIQMAEPIRAVGEVVAAAQDLDAAQVLCLRKPHVGIPVDQRGFVVVD